MDKQCHSRETKQGNYLFTPPPNIPGGPMVVNDAIWEECGFCGQQLLSPALSRALQELSIQRQGLLLPARNKQLTILLDSANRALSISKTHERSF